MAAENNNNNNNNNNNSNTTSSGAGRSSNATADSYIGSLISLSSKSEIRYEGVLYNINTEESSIGLKNVRSFGTEGRKKDGPQIPPSDKVYEYILFRGTDIKDLQVKSSPPVQPTPSINNDPAIIQSHYPRPVSTPTSLPPAGSGPLGDVGSHNNQMGLPASNFQGGLPWGASPAPTASGPLGDVGLYQPGGSIGTWGALPAPTASGSGLAMPMYWPGYYGPPNGLLPLHQQSLLRPPPGLSISSSMQQQPMQYPNFNTPLSAGASSLSVSNLPSTVPNVTPPLINASTTSLNLASTSSASLALPPSLTPVPYLTSTSSASSALPSLTPVPSATISSENLPSLMPNKVPSMTLPSAHLTASLPSVSPLPTSSLELNAIVPPISNKPNVVSGPTIPNQGSAQSTSSVGVASASLRTEAATPSLVTPGQLLQSGPSSVQPVQVLHKDVEVIQVSSSSPPGLEPLIPVPAEALPPILPFPVPSHAAHKPNGAPFNNQRHGYRGSGRGRGRGIVSSRPVTKFTEDFDFEAMNEKFKKDEVWGHLGKSNKSHSMDKGSGSDEDDSQDEYDDDLAKIEIKSVYKKDDFFDTLSCNTLDHDPQNGRARFSEQMKLDTETFGDFSQYRGGRGGRGPPRGGSYRGSYYRRGYGYGGYGSRGRGRGHAY